MCWCWTARVTTSIIATYCKSAGCAGSAVKCAGFPVGCRTISLTWSDRLILRDRGKERPYIEASTKDHKGLFMLQSNEYFDGKVKSIGFTSSSTGRASVGVMAEGEYTFGTAQPEEMTVVSGALNVLLPGKPSGKCMPPVKCSMSRATASFICRWLSQPLTCAAICDSLPSCCGRKACCPLCRAHPALISAVLLRPELPPDSESMPPVRRSSE